MAKQHCKCKEAECEECPEWIFTFADLVMLMMGFFVILWVLTPKNTAQGGNANKEWLDAVIEIRKAFDYLPDANSTDPIDIEMIKRKLQNLKDPLKGKGEGGETHKPRQGAEGTDPEVTTVRPGKEAVVGTRLLFDTGKAALTPQTMSEIDEIVKLIKGHTNIVLVKGHAALDDFAADATEQQKMDLSVRRAQAVVAYMTDRGMEPENLRVQGCSTFEPILQRVYNGTAAVNRRVEIEVKGELVRDRQDATHAGAVPRPSPDLPAGIQAATPATLPWPGATPAAAMPGSPAATAPGPAGIAGATPATMPSPAEPRDNAVPTGFRLPGAADDHAPVRAGNN